MRHSEDWYQQRLQVYFDNYFKQYEETAEWHVNPAPNKWKFDIPELSITVRLTCTEKGLIFMNTRKVLDMLDSDKIDELRKLLQDEIYEESLKAKPGSKKRYAAMKKYFTYHKPPRECLQKPCKIEFEDKEYISFTNSWSLVLTTEDTGEIELYDNKNGKYPDVGRLIRFDGIKKKIDIRKVIAEAKSKGYKLNKTEVGHMFKYVLLYDGTYYKVGLLDASFSIIDDGEIAMTYHPDGYAGPLTIQNSLGICMIMPVKFDSDPEKAEKIVIELE